MILSATPIPRTASPPSYDTSEFPALSRWYQMLEAVKTNATILADTTGNDTTLAVVENGTGNADAEPNAIACTPSAGNEVYSSGGGLISIGTNSLIIEIDANLSLGGDASAHIIECGDPFTNNKGFGVFFNESLGSLGFRVRDEANTGTVSTTMSNTPDVSGARNHEVIVWDRSIADPGSVQYYVNGSLNNTYALSGTVGTSHDAVGSSTKVGYRLSGDRVLTGNVYNIRIWTPATIPSNISNIVAQMTKNPDELPSLMSGVS